VRASGIGAVFAFPLQIGAARLGVMDIFRRAAGPLARGELALALTFAEVAVSTLLDEQQHAGDTGDPERLGESLGSRTILFQAQGMVMVQIGGSIADAMVAIRAYAYAEDRRLGDVAADIVAGRLRLNTPNP
jgi:AmiR/NasT family two-component response regulator